MAGIPERSQWWETGTQPSQQSGCEGGENPELGSLTGGITNTGRISNREKIITSPAQAKDSITTGQQGDQENNEKLKVN